MKAIPHVNRDEDPLEKLRIIGKEVDRAVMMAKRVREEVESVLSTALFPPPAATHGE